MAKPPFIENKPHPVHAPGTELAETRGLLRRGHCAGAADGERQTMFNYEIAVGQQIWTVLSSGFSVFKFFPKLSAIIFTEPRS